MINEPIQKIRLGRVSLSVFENTHKRLDGKTFKSKSAVLQTGYMKKGKWVNPKLTILQKDLTLVREVLRQCVM